VAVFCGFILHENIKIDAKKFCANVSIFYKKQTLFTD